MKKDLFKTKFGQKYFWFKIFLVENNWSKNFGSTYFFGKIAGTKFAKTYAAWTNAAWKNFTGTVVPHKR